MLYPGVYTEGGRYFAYTQRVGVILRIHRGWALFWDGCYLGRLLFGVLFGTVVIWDGCYLGRLLFGTVVIWDGCYLGRLLFGTVVIWGVIWVVYGMLSTLCMVAPLATTNYISCIESVQCTLTTCGLLVLVWSVLPHWNCKAKSQLCPVYKII